MKAMSVVAIVAVALPASLGAQPVADDLRCYKVKDPAAKATYTANIGGLVAQPGCTLRVPAILACVPATSTDIDPPPPGGGGGGTPGTFACYKIKCRKTVLPTLQLSDQFGNRSVTPRASNILCTPVTPPTTTTISVSTTTTTLVRGCIETDCECYGSLSNTTCNYHAACTDSVADPAVRCPTVCAAAGGWTGQGTCGSPSSPSCAGDPNCIPIPTTTTSSTSTSTSTTTSTTLEMFCVETRCSCFGSLSNIQCAYHATCADPSSDPAARCPILCAGAGGWTGQGTCGAPSSPICTNDPNCVP